MTFNLNDKVKKIGQQDVFTVEEVRDNPSGEKLYWIQLGNDFATRVYAKESELELVEKAKKPESTPGFYPSRSITD